MASALVGTRVCRSCGEAKPLTAEFFHVGAMYRGGFRPVCKRCVNERLTAYKTEQRRARGAKPRRKPRFVDGEEQWLCTMPDCGWHARTEFYLSDGCPRPLCKRCHCEQSLAIQRRPEVQEQVRQRLQQRKAEQRPDLVRKLEERTERYARGVRICPGCQQELPFAEFQPTADRPKGKRSRCNKCRNIEATRYSRERRERDPEGARALVRARQARVRGAPVCDLTKAQWLTIRAAYEDRCAFCGRQCRVSGPPGPDRLTQEHGVPVTKGGWHSASNIFPACLSCNASKQERTVEEFAEQSGRVLDRGPHPFL